MDKLKFKIKTLEAIDSIFDQTQKMEEKRNRLNENMKQKYDKQIDALKKRRKEMKEKLDELEDSSEENWEEVKDTLSVSLKHYKAGFAELGKLFK